VVRDLQHIDALGVRGEAASEQLRVHLLLDITGEHQPPRAEVEVEDDRDVVDSTARVRRPQRNGSANGPADIHAHAVQPQDIARGDHPALPSELRELASVRGVTRSRTNHAGLDDLAYAISLQHGGEPRNVVLVWMRQDHEVDTAIPQRDTGVKQGDETVWIRAAVDQCSPT
jgi:hypothetical protein